ncbi:MAG: peptidase M23 [Saprospirales bacterium]|nr:peptidase M23 [Saprospirales bacterium]
MTEEKKQGSRWERLKDNYRLVVMNKDTFEEVGAYNLSLLNVYILISSVVVLVAILVWLAFAFTPLARLLPNNHTVDHETLVKLYQDLDSLEQLTEAQATYNESFRRMLTGEVQYEPEGEVPTTPNLDSVFEEIPISEEEQELRREFEIQNGTAQALDQSGVPVNISPRDKPLEQMYFSPPISGTITANFNKDENHLGVDVVAPKNTPIKAALDGWIIFSDWTLETGNTIAIQHANNIVTFYKHNSSLLKKTGSFVRAGEAIAIIGNTGELSDGPHLHFELWHEGKPVNPTDFVDFK